jgi:ribosomal protein L15E
MASHSPRKSVKLDFWVEPERARIYDLCVDILRARGEEQSLSRFIRETLDDRAARLIAEARRTGEVG